MDQCPFSKIVWFLISRKIVRSGTQGACWGKASKKVRHKTIDKDPLASAWLPPLYLYITSLFMCLLYLTGFSISPLLFFFYLQCPISSAMEIHISFLLLQNIPSDCFPFSLSDKTIYKVLLHSSFSLTNVWCSLSNANPRACLLLWIHFKGYLFSHWVLFLQWLLLTLCCHWLLVFPLSDLIMFFIFSLLFFHRICFIWWLLLFFYSHLTSVPCVVALQMSLSLRRMWLPFLGSILLLGCIVFKYYFI